ncbi:hypothetical protein Tco_1236904 [Tanacetum coccineum]
MELHDVSYGIEYVARPLLLFFSSENRLLWFRYREYDLAHLKLVFEFSIYKVWKSVGYGVSMYWIRRIGDFLEHGYAVSSLMDTTHLGVEESLREQDSNKGKGKEVAGPSVNLTEEGVLNAAAGGIFLYKTPNQAYQLLEDKVLLKLDWAKKQKTKSSLKKTVAFAIKGSSNSDTDKIMARMDAMAMKMDA